MNQPEQLVCHCHLKLGLGVCLINREAEGSRESVAHEEHDFARAGEAVRSA